MKKQYKYGAVTAILAVATLARLGLVYSKDVFNDFNAYYDVSSAILRGLDPYALKNLSLKWVDPPIVFPGYVVFYFPFTFFSLDVAKYLYLTMNIVLGVLLCLTFFRRVFAVKGREEFSFDGESTLCLAGAMFVFLNSSPFLTCLKQGQTSIIIAFCLLSILSQSEVGVLGYLQMSIAAVLKYTMLPLYGLMLFCRRRFKLCLVSFAMFLFWGSAPILFGHNLVTLYFRYISVLSEQIGGGFNSFPISGYNMVQLDFIKIPFVGMVLKVAFFVIFIHLSIKNIRERRIGANFAYMTMCVTMIVAYHRVYDLVLVIPFLIVCAVALWRDKRLMLSGVCGAFLLFFLLPESVVFTISNIIGGIVGENSVFYLSVFGRWHAIFPVLPLVMLSMTVFSIYLCYRTRETFFLPLGSLDCKEEEEKEYLGCDVIFNRVRGVISAGPPSRQEAWAIVTEECE